MKRIALLLAAGVLGGAAHAQSDVAIAGVIDTNIQRFNSSSGGSSNRVGNSGYASSRIIFRGTEDLGGGMAAGFWLEAGLNPDNGTGVASNTNNQITGATSGGGLTFNRLSYVNLKGGWGEIKLGRDFTQTHWVNVLYEPFNGNGIGKMLNFAFTGVGSAPPITAVVTSNTVSYWTPPGLGGFFGVIQYGFGENPSNAANSQDGNTVSLRAGHNAGPLKVAGGYTRTRYVSTATLGDYSHANLGATWDAGFAKLFAFYGVVRVNLLAGEIRKGTAMIGTIVPLTPTTSLRASYSVLNDKSAGGLLNANGSRRSTNDGSQVAIGLVHDLSKRSALYGTYAHLKNKGQGAYGVGGPAPGLGENASGLELGFRHSF